jgi:hypothetical protein
VDVKLQGIKDVNIDMGLKRPFARPQASGLKPQACHPACLLLIIDCLS